MGVNESKVYTEGGGYDIGKDYTRFLKGIRPGESLYQFIDRVVQPDTDYLNRCNSTVDLIVRFLHERVTPRAPASQTTPSSRGSGGAYHGYGMGCGPAPETTPKPHSYFCSNSPEDTSPQPVRHQSPPTPTLHKSLSRCLPPEQLKKVNVKEILKSGSLGKSTAVKNKSDIDLILFLNGIETISTLRSCMPAIHSCIKELFEEFGKSGHYPWLRNITYKKPSQYAVSCVMTIVDDDGYMHEREMDLLPAVDITRTDSLANIYDKMDRTDEELRRYYSACLSRIQKEFVQNETTTAKVKNLIRLLKKWAKEERVPIRSYFIELLVIYNQRKHPEPDFKIPVHVKEILQLLSQCDTLKICFHDNYNPDMYRNTKNKELPYLLCPANPFMNTAPTLEDARKVARMAKALLMLPLFQ